MQEMLNFKSHPVKSSKDSEAQSMKSNQQYSSSGFLKTSSTKSSNGEAQGTMKRINTAANFNQDNISTLLKHSNHKVPRHSFAGKRGIAKDSDSSKGSMEISVNNEYQRRSSFLSYNCLSLQSDAFSVVDSNVSVYAPSVNEHVICQDATQEELDIHNFLDDMGAFQVNVKD